jgi:hypothetical protein
MVHIAGSNRAIGLSPLNWQRAQRGAEVSPTLAGRIMPGWPFRISCEGQAQ